ncbi:MAG: metallophosphoesterase [FCB group bacterium]|nr:metallophosphoesterase [FCB group bacterium]
MVFLWGFGLYYSLDSLSFGASLGLVLVFIWEVCLIFSLPFSGFLHFVDWILEKLFHRTHRQRPSPFNNNRRLFLKTTAAAIPVITLATGASGMVNSLGKIKVYKKVIVINNLPPQLNGFKILHISDMHLRHFVTLDDLEDLLRRAKKYNPHLILVSGDIADDLKLLGPSLKLMEQLQPPFGIYASLGNHEYYRGIKRVKKEFERSPIPLLINQGTKLTIGDISIFIGGLDDPRTLSANHQKFFKECLDATLKEKNNDDFTILMSHRPHVFDIATAYNIPLTLAGHTHGGQIGWGHRSLLEPMLPDSYLWGHYQKGTSHLYTSSGVGQWFPFRLGCPQEAPIIEMRKG